MPKAVVIDKIEGKPGRVYYPLKITKVSKPKPSTHELLVRITHAALNHRDLFIRQHLYPGTTFGVPLLADGCGIVVETGSSNLDAQWANKRIILTPGRGWAQAMEGPEEGQYAILGGTRFCPLGTLQEYLTVDASEVEEAPDHLTGPEAAALPLTGVALMALQLASAVGCNVFVTSGTQEKLDRAKELGAQGGAIYKEDGWERKIAEQLPVARNYLDAVIDGAGGDIVDRVVKILKVGGVIVSYGMTLGPNLPFPMSAVLKNIEVRGSTMGSRTEFRSMTEFIATKHIRPVVSRVIHGIDDLGQLDGLYEDMKRGKQFGKLVIDVAQDESHGLESEEKSRL
ncbi:MAG: hypothetical protein M1817_005181 [Caeruleum heppii]|nr:MAG: hypothetical protein M1817_005181 [Caeruleum heppii]